MIGFKNLVPVKKWVENKLTKQVLYIYHGFFFPVYLFLTVQTTSEEWLEGEEDHSMVLVVHRKRKMHKLLIALFTQLRTTV